MVPEVIKIVIFLTVVCEADQRQIRTFNTALSHSNSGTFKVIVAVTIVVNSSKNISSIIVNRGEGSEFGGNFRRRLNGGYRQVFVVICRSVVRCQHITIRLDQYGGDNGTDNDADNYASDRDYP